MLENNLSETAFAVKEVRNEILENSDSKKDVEANNNVEVDNGENPETSKVYYKLRWFTPGGEIDLCGHATLACSFVIMNYYEKNADTVIFNTLSGDLVVNRKKDISSSSDLYELDFPEYDLKPVEITDEMIELIGEKPVEAYMGRDLMCVFEDENFVLNAKMNAEKIKKLDGLLLHITAKYSENTEKEKIKNDTDKIDCISRSFAPKLDFFEDSVCGSGHCHIAPYWIKNYRKKISLLIRLQREAELFIVV